MPAYRGEVEKSTGPTRSSRMIRTRSRPLTCSGRSFVNLRYERVNGDFLMWAGPVDARNATTFTAAQGICAFRASFNSTLERISKSVGHPRYGSGAHLVLLCVVNGEHS
jgi:hypothetical protein